MQQHLTAKSGLDRIGILWFDWPNPTRPCCLYGSAGAGPLWQPAAASTPRPLIDVLQVHYADRIKCAVDTCGMSKWMGLRAISPLDFTQKESSGLPSPRLPPLRLQVPLEQL